MKLFVGLGNPEPKYLKNRHNVGAMTIDALNGSLKTQYKRKPPVFSEKFLQNIVWDYSPFAVLAKPLKFMNDSGVAVKKLFDAYKPDPEDLYIIHDDLDIPIGQYKIQNGKGPKDHNGILSIESELGFKNFGRIRVGIENRMTLNESNESKGRISGADYVLENFTPEEERVVKWVIQKIIHDKFFESLRYA